MKKIFDCCSHLYTTTHDLFIFSHPHLLKCIYNYLFNEITKKLKNQIFLFRFKLNLTNEKKPVNIYIYIRLCLHFFL